MMSHPCLAFDGAVLFSPQDVIQQRLCCPQTVALIEKCARFHLHCAHRLCEEPMSVFEAKINNENLTKCLQSLKEMYQDLKDRHAYCPREAEFRQYSVLLNLNDGDILRSVGRDRPSRRAAAKFPFRNCFHLVCPVRCSSSASKCATPPKCILQCRRLPHSTATTLCASSSW